jgi:hypothetical protein
MGGGLPGACRYRGATGPMAFWGRAWGIGRSQGRALDRAGAANRGGHGAADRELAQGPSVQAEAGGQAPGRNHCHGQLDRSPAGDGNPRSVGPPALSQPADSTGSAAAQSAHLEYMTLSLTPLGVARFNRSFALRRTTGGSGTGAGPSTRTRRQRSRQPAERPGRTRGPLL